MEIDIKFQSIPKLTQLTSVKIVTFFWTSQINSSSINRYEDFKIPWGDLKIKDVIKTNICLLKLPTSLKDELKGLVKPIGLHIIQWLADHKDLHNLTGLMDNIKFLNNGIIDRKSTAENLVKHVNIESVSRYKLSSVYCLEKYIRKSWRKMSKRERNNFYEDSHVLSEFWMYKLEGNAAIMNSLIQRRMGVDGYSPFQFGFLIAAEIGNLAATKYFWTKISAEDRKKSLLDTAKKTLSKGRRSCGSNLDKRQYGEVLCFLLSQMNKEEQHDIFRKHPLAVLIFLADWSLEDILVQVLSCVGNIVHEKEYFAQYKVLLTNIADKEEADCIDCFYKQLFTKCLLHTPLALKKVVRCIFPLSKLFAKKDSRNIILILEDEPEQIRREIILSKAGMDICKQLVIINNLELLELFIKECAPTQDDVLELRESIALWHSTLYAKEILEKISIVTNRIEEQKYKRFKY